MPQALDVNVEVSDHDALGGWLDGFLDASDGPAPVCKRICTIAVVSILRALYLTAATGVVGRRGPAREWNVAAVT